MIKDYGFPICVCLALIAFQIFMLSLSVGDLVRAVRAIGVTP